MQFSPFFLVWAACAATFGFGQALLPTAHAHPAKALLSAPYRVRVESLHMKRTAAGLEITGQILNTGRQTLTYTSVAAVFTDAAGQEIGRGDGYLAAGPLRPGQAAEFRACSPSPPAFAGVSVWVQEAGHSVKVEMSGPELLSQASDKRRTTVW